MSEKETMKEKEPEKSSETALEIEDLDATDTEDVKGGRPPQAGTIVIESHS